MSERIKPAIKASLVRGVFYLLLLLAVSLAAGVMLLFAATKITATNTNDSRSTLNFQPGGGCFLTEFFDNVTPPALPPGWTAINGINPDGILWQTSNSGNPTPPAHSLPNAAWVNDPDTISDKYLDSPGGTVPPQTTSVDLHFSNNYALEDEFDGGVLEISVDGGPFKTFLQLVPFSVAATMARSAPVVAIPSLVAKRGQVTRVVSSILM
jgi:hypothetical protein